MRKDQYFELAELGLAFVTFAATKYRLELLSLATRYGFGGTKPLLEHFAEALVVPFLADYTARAVEHVTGPMPTFRRVLFAAMWTGYVCSEMVMEGLIQPSLYNNRPIQVEQIGLMAAGTTVGILAFGITHRWGMAKV